MEARQNQVTYPMTEQETQFKIGELYYFNNRKVIVTYVSDRKKEGFKIEISDDLENKMNPFFVNPSQLKKP